MTNELMNRQTILNLISIWQKEFLVRQQDTSPNAKSRENDARIIIHALERQIALWNTVYAGL